MNMQLKTRKKIQGGAKVWKQVWADGRAVVYFFNLSDLETWAKKQGKWLEPVGRPKLVVRPKGVRVH